MTCFSWKVKGKCLINFKAPTNGAKVAGRNRAANYHSITTGFQSSKRQVV